MDECLAFLFQEASSFPHPDYEEFEREINVLKHIGKPEIKVRNETITAVSFKSENDAHERWEEFVGYFPTEEDAKIALRGLCPWDFNTMWGSGYYRDFIFKTVALPHSTNFLRPSYDMKEQNELLIKARKHAVDMGGMWHHRSPKNWA